MTTHEDDRGMQAVRRVRSVREQDSLLGLQKAVAERKAAGSRVSSLRARLLAADGFSAGTTASFLAVRSALNSITGSLTDAERTWQASKTVTALAQSQWHQDNTRLAAIDLLLERREAERKAERDRRSARDLDELAMQRWMRNRSERERGER